MVRSLNWFSFEGVCNEELELGQKEKKMFKSFERELGMNLATPIG